MIGKVLIANRGEIALRIVRACREMGLGTTAVYSKVDRDLAHLDLADDAVCIGAVSYLDPANLIMAARATGADAVHPGYGFLAEDAAFASAVIEAGLVFVGPAPETIALMGNKVSARAAAVAHGLEVIPGSSAAVKTVDEALEAAATTGYPAAIKAAAGGGGRGIRPVWSAAEVATAFELASEEARTFFGDPAVYVERYLDSPRHIEVQVLGDGAGGAIHLGTRDCSVQRRHQKILEEGPAINVDPDATARLLATCVACTSTLAYRGVGTFEFLYEDGAYYFLEMNTRLQVEHPVTEAITGLDLVKAQLHVAATGSLPFSQDDVVIRGHAIESRINAEDADFRPAPGRVTSLTWPGGPGVRIDSHLYAGYEIPHHYDSLVAKVTSHGANRTEAIARQQGALSELSVRGVETSRALQIKVLGSEMFATEAPTTRFLEAHGWAGTT